MLIYRQCLAALLGLLLVAGWLGRGYAQTGERTFPETGYSVAGEFLLYYQAASDPLMLFGYPISEAFQDPISGCLVQYFQRVRFDLHPENPPDRHVVISDLGEYLYTPGPASPVRLIPGACRYYPGSNFPVCYAFRDFFEAHGGVTQFGLPISGFEQQDGRLVQYFEKARFEWRPEQPAGQRVQLSDLGRLHLDLIEAQTSPGWHTPSEAVPERIQVFAYLKQPVTGLKGQQTACVQVIDQSQQPVAGAQVTLQMMDPEGKARGDLPQAITDQRGAASITLPFQHSLPGQVIVRVTARYNNLESSTTCSFWAWW